MMIKRWDNFTEYKERTGLTLMEIKKKCKPSVGWNKLVSYNLRETGNRTFVIESGNTIELIELASSRPRKSDITAKDRFILCSEV